MGGAKFESIARFYEYYATLLQTLAYVQTNTVTLVQVTDIDITILTKNLSMATGYFGRYFRSLVLLHTLQG